MARNGVPQRRRPAAGPKRARREFAAESLAEAEGGYTTGRKRTGLRLTFHGGLPESVWGRVLTGAGLLSMAGLVFAGFTLAERLMLRDQRFVIPSSAAITIEGDHHLTRGQVLAALGSVAGRNVFSLSLDRERATLEQMPWVQHATVMRLLPDHLSATITERTPVAFARNGKRVELVDASGVLLDMGSGERYSFPVVTGISPADPDSVRASRMRIFGEFTAALDATGQHLSAKLSEVDLSNPEDVKALVPENGSDVLVHFGDSEYLERFERFEKLLPAWRAQYPKLSGVDMRYERQVVLQMQPEPGASHASSDAATPVPIASSTLSAKVKKKPNTRATHEARAHAPALKPMHHSAVPR